MMIIQVRGSLLSPADFKFLLPVGAPGGQAGPEATALLKVPLAVIIQVPAGGSLLSPTDFLGVPAAIKSSRWPMLLMPPVVIFK